MLFVIDLLNCQSPMIKIIIKSCTNFTKMALATTNRLIVLSTLYGNLVRNPILTKIKNTNFSINPTLFSFHCIEIILFCSIFSIFFTVDLNGTLFFFFVKKPPIFLLSYTPMYWVPPFNGSEIVFQWLLLIDIRSD